MTMQVNMHEAKTHFSKLAEAVERGEEVIIAKSGKPLMRLVKIETELPPIEAGFAKELFAGVTEENWLALDREMNSLFKEQE